MRSAPPRALPESTTELDPVAYAKSVAGRVLITLTDITENGGGRGSGSQVAAGRLLLEVARLLGSQREEPTKLDAVKEAAKVIYLVDADRAQQLLAEQRAAERKP